MKTKWVLHAKVNVTEDFPALKLCLYFGRKREKEDCQF